MAGNGGFLADACLAEDEAFFALLENPTERPDEDLRKLMELCCRLLLDIHAESLTTAICSRLGDWDRGRAQELRQEFIVDAVFERLRVQVGGLVDHAPEMRIERKWGSLLQWALARLGRIRAQWGWLANRVRVRRLVLPLGDDGSSIQGVDGSISIKSDETRDSSNASGERGDALSGLVAADTAAELVQLAEFTLQAHLEEAEYKPFERFVIEVARASERAGIDAQGVARLAIRHGLLGRARSSFQRALIVEFRRVLQSRGMGASPVPVDQSVLADLANAEVHALVSVFDRRSLSWVQKILAVARKSEWWGDGS